MKKILLIMVISITGVFAEGKACVLPPEKKVGKVKFHLPEIYCIEGYKWIDVTYGQVQMMKDGSYGATPVSCDCKGVR